MGRFDRYGIVLDAGSSGTRIYIYRWEDHEQARLKATSSQLRGLPKIVTKKEWTLKKKPGVSTYGSNPYQVGEYLAPLLEHAKLYIPKNSIPDTPIFLLATAGVRLLEPTQQKLLLEQICAYFRKNSGFLLPDCGVHVQVISGETEGLYGWIAANYLLGGFDHSDAHDHGKGHHTYGFLDMGGASAQIAFAPNATEAKKHADDLELLRLRTLDGQPSEYRVFVTTWLKFGMNEARNRYVERLIEQYAGPGIKELPDPCLPKGLFTTLDGDEDLKKKKKLGEPILAGTGKFEECLSQTFPLLGKDIHCLNAPCLLKGVHVPEIDFEVNHFVGVSEYWHTTHEIFNFGENAPYDFTSYQKKVKEFCSLDWSIIEKSVEKYELGKHVDEEKARQACFKASWLINIMHDGIGIPRFGIEASGKAAHNLTDQAMKDAQAKGFLNPFQAVDKINSMEVSWTLGKMALYASSQIPPANPSGTFPALPVGFGSNTADDYSIPSDWQYAESTNYLPPNAPTSIPPDFEGTKSQGAYNSSENDLWKHKMLSPQRGPGAILLFLLLLALIILLIGRERRGRIVRHIGIFFTALRSRARRSLSKRKFLGNPDVQYERVLEEGSTDDFELSPVDDDSSSDSSSGGSSGFGRGESEGWKRAKVKEGKSKRGQAGTTGLMVRTDSRERISRSRDVSPTRLAARARSPLPRFS